MVPYWLYGERKSERASQHHRNSRHWGDTGTGGEHRATPDAAANGYPPRGPAISGGCSSTIVLVADPDDIGSISTH